MENKSPKVSIIVPVYKAERYLHRCVDSLLTQSFVNFELLLIDDGSPDNSGNICDDYALKDTRIRVFHKVNGGVASARQCGLDNSVGEYLIHCDPDDWVESTMIEELYNKAKDDRSDLVICDFYSNYLERQLYIKQQPSSLDNETVLKELFNHLYGSCWNKLIRKDFIKEKGICFDLELSFCEDLYFHASLLMHKAKISYLPKAFYHYDKYSNENSICQSYGIDSYKYDKRIYNKFCELLYQTNAYDAAEINMGYLIFSRAFWGNIFTSSEFKTEFYNYIPYVKNKALGLCKFFMLLSCQGYYKPSMFVYKSIIFIRKRIKRLFNK